MRFFANSKREWFLIGVVTGLVVLPALAATIGTLAAISTGV